ncbi:MAG: hypothetical protein IPI21_05815 [Propionivibrio sp.]|nr:hypothetical protein [Propionivibrio sp.]
MSSLPLAAFVTLLAVLQLFVTALNVGRFWYAVAYQINPDKRGGGFGLAMLAFAGLWLGALWGVVRVMAH